jgi:hypothetical protein
LVPPNADLSASIRLQQPARADAWDLKRLVASFAMAARSRRPSDARARDAAIATALAYRTGMAIVAEENTLDAWYAAVTWEGVLRGVKDAAAVFQHLKEVAVAARHHTSEYVFHKLATEKKPERYACSTNRRWSVPATTVCRRGDQGRRRQQRRHPPLCYFDDGGAERAHLSANQRGTAIRACWSQPVPLPGATRENACWSVNACYRRLRTSSLAGREDRRHYCVRQLRDMNASVDLASMDAREAELYAGLCGETLLAHQQRPAAPRGSPATPGNADAFDIAMGEYAIAYADGTGRDYELFRRAAAAGRIKIETSPLWALTDTARPLASLT